MKDRLNEMKTAVAPKAPAPPPKKCGASIKQVTAVKDRLNQMKTAAAPKAPAPPPKNAERAFTTRDLANARTRDMVDATIKRLGLISVDQALVANETLNASMNELSNAVDMQSDSLVRRLVV